MTDNNIRLAIAKIFGWTIEDSGGGLMWHLNGISSEEAPPLYCEDLNAMYDAYKYLISISIGASSRRQPDIKFSLHLMGICNPDKILWKNGMFLGNHFDALKAVNATAKQRAEAFLRAINLWEDSSNKG